MRLTDNMRLTKKLAGFAAIAALSSGLLMAQAPGRRDPGQRMMNFFATALELTDTQKEQIQGILEDAREQSQPLAQSMRQNRADLTAAIKAGKTDAELEALAKAQGDLAGQLAAIHAKSRAKVYTLLTPEQKEKADKMGGMLFGGMGPGAGPGRMGGPGARRAK